MSAQLGTTRQAMPKRLIPPQQRVAFLGQFSLTAVAFRFGRQVSAHPRRGACIRRSGQQLLYVVESPFQVRLTPFTPFYTEVAKQTTQVLTERGGMPPFACPTCCRCASPWRHRSQLSPQPDLP